MPEIINRPVNFEETSETGQKCITRAQRHGTAALCVPVAVEIKGGSYFPVTDRNKLRPWHIIGEFRFSLFIRKGQKRIVEKVVRYNLTGDGRMRRLIDRKVGGYLADEETNDVEPQVLHGNNDPLSIQRPRISWREDAKVRGVDAKVRHVLNLQTGQEEAILHFIAVPEPGQFRGTEGFGDIFPGADRLRTLTNTIDNPVPYLQPVGVVF